MYHFQDGMSFQQNKLYPILLVVMRLKSGLFVSNIAQVKSIIVIDAVYNRYALKTTLNLSCSTH